MNGCPEWASRRINFLVSKFEVFSASYFTYQRTIFKSFRHAAGVQNAGNKSPQHKLVSISTWDRKSGTTFEAYLPIEMRGNQRGLA
jgi:hypothetical protein